jgi:hypothetical protein
MPPAQDPQALTQEQARLPAYRQQQSDWIYRQNVAAKEAEEQAQKEAKDQEARAQEAAARVTEGAKEAAARQEEWIRSWSWAPAPNPNPAPWPWPWP